MGCRLYGLFLVRASAPFPRHMLDVTVLDMVQLGVCVCVCALNQLSFMHLPNTPKLVSK